MINNEVSYFKKSERQLSLFFVLGGFGWLNG